MTPFNYDQYWMSITENVLLKLSKKDDAISFLLSYINLLYGLLSLDDWERGGFSTSFNGDGIHEKPYERNGYGH